MAEGDYKKNLFTPRNIIIYLVVAILLYGAIYYLFLSNKNGSPYQTPTSQTEEEQMPSENTMTVALAAQNDSGEDGTAVLTEENGKTKVVVKVENTMPGVSQPAHIHMGACPAPGEVVYPLTNVLDGMSETVLDVTLATLQSELPLAVNVHKSAAEADVYVSCGDLK